MSVGYTTTLYLKRNMAGGEKKRVSGIERERGQVQLTKPESIEFSEESAAREFQSNIDNLGKKYTLTPNGKFGEKGKNCRIIKSKNQDERQKISLINLHNDLKRKLYQMARAKCVFLMTRQLLFLYLKHQYKQPGCLY